MRLTRVLYTNIINECQSPTCHGPATLCLQHLTVTRSTTCAKSRYWSKTNIFSYPTCIRRIRQGLSVGYWRKVWCGKLEWFVYLTLKMFEDMITRFHAILKRFRQQDRQTDRHRHRAMVYAELMYSIAWQIYYNIKTRGVVDR